MMNEKPSSYTEIFAELKASDYKSYNNNIDDDFGVSSSYMANNSMLPVLDQTVRNRPSINNNDVITRK